MIIKDYFSLVKFSHTIFAMPFALMGFFIGVNNLSGYFPWKILGLVLLCMIFARNAAMAFNRYIDREFDSQNSRTSNREIPTGKISPRSALTFVIINSVLFCTTSFFINKLAFILSPLALSLVLGYSLSKRYTRFCHFILGLCLAIAPTAAYISVTGEFSLVCMIISCLVLFWVSGFDILYSLSDADFDKEKGLKSIPEKLGIKNAMLLSSILHIVTIILTFVIAIIGHFGILYYIGALIFSTLLIYQHLILSPKNLSRLNAAFFTMNGIASVLYSIFVILDLYF